MMSVSHFHCKIITINHSVAAICSRNAFLIANKIILLSLPFPIMMSWLIYTFLIAFCFIISPIVVERTYANDVRKDYTIE